MEKIATFYAIRDHKGLWYRTYTNGHSAGWVKLMADGRIYSKLSAARSKVTALANESPRSPVPELVEFSVSKVTVIDQTERVAATRVKKAEEEARQDAARAHDEMVKAEAEFEKAKVRLMRLKSCATGVDK